MSDRETLERQYGTSESPLGLLIREALKDNERLRVEVGEAMLVVETQDSQIERLRVSAEGWQEEAKRSHQNVAWREARIDAALEQLKRNLCDCREDDCRHCELVRLTVDALKGEK